MFNKFKDWSVVRTITW